MARTGSTLAALAVLVALGTGGYEFWKHTPPFQRGLHTVETISRPSPRLGQCPIFPADNIWNTPIDRLPLLPCSAKYSDAIGPLRKLHPDFGSSMRFGIPFTEVPPGTRPLSVDFEYAEESDAVGYPVPPDAPIEGVSVAGSDRHVLLIDPRTCTLYELYHAERKPDGVGWTAGSGIHMDLATDALRPDGKTSADAAGLPIFPGLLRFDEVASGEVNHALRFTLQHTQAAYLWPARHKASSLTDLNLPALGTRFRLRADFDLSRYSASNQVILRALQRYGMFLADNGSSMYLSGVSDKRWNDYDLRKLNAIHAEDFEAVDESSLEITPDSARAGSR